MSVETEAIEEAPTPGVEPLSGMAYRYAMGLLLGICVVNYLDRQVINILAEAIKHELHLKDWQLGMMSGLAFGTLYTFLGLPIARAAERGDRPLIMAAAMAIWSGFTVACGLVRNFGQLILARIGVGVGEAGCTPAAYSLIMDYARPEKRASALSTYGMGTQIGGLLGLVFGGLIADAYGWRTAFLVAGSPGLLMAVLAVTTLKEPRRTIGRRIVKAKATAGDIGAMFRLVRSKPSYWFLMAAITADVFIPYGYGAFLAPFFLRNHASELASAAASISASLHVNLKSTGLLGLTLGIVGSGMGALGTFTGGRFGDRFGAADPIRYLLGPAVAALIAAPVLSGAVLAPWLGLAVALIAVNNFLAGFWYGPSFAAWLSMVPSHMRATNGALILFISNLIGLGIAPLTIGLISDAFAAHVGPAQGIRYALSLLGIIGILTAYLFWQGARTIRADFEITPQTK